MTTTADRTDSLGNVHATAERARFIDFARECRAKWGDPLTWTETQLAEYRSRFVAA